MCKCGNADASYLVAALLARFHCPNPVLRCSNSFALCRQTVSNKALDTVALPREVFDDVTLLLFQKGHIFTQVQVLVR